MSFTNVSAARTKQAAEFLSALSHPGRLAILSELIEAGEASAGTLVYSAKLSQSATSQHLARLRSDGLVKTRRDGQVIFYKLADERVASVVGLLNDLYQKPKAKPAAKKAAAKKPAAKKPATKKATSKKKTAKKK